MSVGEATSESFQDILKCSLELLNEFENETLGNYVPDVTKSESENLEELLEILQNTIDLRDEISTQRDNAQAAWDDWSGLIKSLKDKDKQEAETKAYHRFKTDKDITNTFSSAAKKLISLNKLVNKLQKEKRLLENSIRASGLVTPNPTPVGTGTIPTSTIKVKLGKLPEKFFSGNVEDWSDFGIFSIIPLTKIQICLM